MDVDKALYEAPKGLEEEAEEVTAIEIEVVEEGEEDDLNSRNFFSFFF